MRNRDVMLNKQKKQYIKGYNMLREKSRHSSFCIAPSTSLRFHRNGGVQICCHHIAFEFLKEKSLKDIWFGEQFDTLRKQMKDYDIPDSCNFCASPFYSQDYKNVNALEFDYLEPNDNGFPALMDFSLDNTCNLACIMCDASLSSSIQMKKEPKEKCFETFSYDEDFVSQLEEFIPYLKFAVFTGGEPFLIKSYYSIWDKMIELNKDIIINNARTPELGKARRILMEVMDSAIKAGDPVDSIRKGIKLKGERLEIAGCNIDLNHVGKIVVVGGGKAGVAMAVAIEQILGDWLTGGIVNIPEGMLPESYIGKIKFVEASHPIPNSSAVEGTRGMLSLVTELNAEDMVIFLVSGGGSAIIPLPAEGIALTQLQELTGLLLKSGASIQELNAVRKHLSMVKGGQLAKAAYPARTISLLISDVVGDGLDTIASGPTYWDSTTFSEAFAVFEKYELVDKVPEEILSHLKDGMKWLIPETPNRGDECFQNACFQIIGSNRDAIEAATKTGRANGLNVKVLTTKLQGVAREVGQNLSNVAKEVLKEGKQTPCLFLLGGETTVYVTGKGIGGRNQELALGAVSGLAGLKNVAMVSFSTDGIDGPTKASGAIVDGYTLQRAKEMGINPQIYLDDNDSYHFFEKLDDLVLTGPTGTNIVDCIALLVL